MSTSAIGGRCTVCGTFVLPGNYHSCGGTPTFIPGPRFTTTTRRVPVKCPVCEGHGRYMPLNPLPVTDPTILCPKCTGERVLWTDETRTEPTP
jgi:DnaJ-class molecular chaperone